MILKCMGLAHTHMGNTAGQENLGGASDAAMYCFPCHYIGTSRSVYTN
jgi:hypothetical protein